MELLIKAVIGAVVVVLMSVIANTRHYFIAGIIPLFPTFALIAHVFVGRNGIIELRHTVLFGMLSLIPYFFYLLSVYLLSEKVTLYVNLFISTVIWLLFAVIVYMVWIKIDIA